MAVKVINTTTHGCGSYEYYNTWRVEVINTMIHIKLQKKIKHLSLNQPVLYPGSHYDKSVICGILPINCKISIKKQNRHTGCYFV